jgi:hypothetical protein
MEQAGYRRRERSAERMAERELQKDFLLKTVAQDEARYAAWQENANVIRATNPKVTQKQLEKEYGLGPMPDLEKGRKLMADFAGGKGFGKEGGGGLLDDILKATGETKPLPTPTTIEETEFFETEKKRDESDEAFRKRNAFAARLRNEVPAYDLPTPMTGFPGQGFPQRSTRMASSIEQALNLASELENKPIGMTDKEAASEIKMYLRRRALSGDTELEEFLKSGEARGMKNLRRLVSTLELARTNRKPK